VERDWETRHAFFAENGRRLEEVEELEHRARRRDLLASDQELFAFFDERVPTDIVSAAHFDRWWKGARRRDPELLTYPRELLVRPEAAAALEGERPASCARGT
jgi:ATP-dependent helicase HrpA